MTESGPKRSGLFFNGVILIFLIVYNLKKLVRN